MSLFDSVELKSEDPILGLAASFQSDPRPKKVNLGIGSYKNAEGKPQVLLAVRRAEKILLERNLDKEYLPILGSADFIQKTLRLIFGEDSKALAMGGIAAAQTIGATGALRLGGDFLFQNKISDTVFLSDPTWPNHTSIFSRAGMKFDYYTYYDFQKNSLNISGMYQSISKIAPGNVILFQPGCHNPTGLVPTFDEWKELSSLILHHRLLPFFDLSYQGFDQSVDEDAKVVRYFAKEGHPMLVAYSYSKNFGLYGERVGLLSLVCKDHEEAQRVSSQIKQIIRGNYSMPPMHGQRIVSLILESKELKEEWLSELENMKNRIKEMRRTFLAALKAKGGGLKFDHISLQSGMFSFTGLNSSQVKRLSEDFGIYMPANGRINAAGLNAENMEYVVDSILSVR